MKPTGGLYSYEKDQVMFKVELSKIAKKKEK